ncbi:hypothetical protein V9T40_003869 [Parthenolecanium corni]|uniref:CDK5 regulatory subunit-associated protein 3 n=1 Tax=Parthenolecanium corni TaxID=536013 RepID=A0AAN9TRH9_9HEMI
MADDIPIDIHIPKLLEWLLSRRHCKIGWQAHIAMVREKINSALEDMPEHQGIVDLLSGSYLNYFHCCQIVEILKETEADSKNLFGIYGSKRMKDWQDITRLYEKDNVYLAEAANILLRNVKYEVPSIRKQLAKYKQMQADCDKKIADYVKSAASGQRELETLKKQLGITGDNVRSELMLRTQHLSEVYENVIANMKVLQKPIQYYSAFSRHVAGVSYTLPLLSYAIDKGNTTTYEWLYGEAPQNVEVTNDQFADVGGSGDAADEIDWDITVADENSGSYDISMDESGIVVESSGQPTNVATGNESYTILDNPKTRDEFINQLLELQSFLKMRLLETQKESDSLFSMNEGVQESSESILKMLDAVQVVKQLMTDSVTQQLHFMKHSNRFIEKTAALFEQKATSIEKMVASQEALKTRKEELIQQEIELKPKLNLIIEKTRELQEQVEREISKKYKNRPVNLMGGF